ncbi:MAG: YesL family protein [Clostridiales bacterium]|nr:YesL family protein [Clostridiales bacterium]
MFELFTSDNKFIVFLRQLADIILLNLIFLLFCLPVVTIGASLASLYALMRQEVEEKEPHLMSEFWKAFKANLKPSLPLWLPMLVIGVLLWFDVQLMQNATGTLAPVLSALVMVAEVLYVFVLSYLFPMLGWFENSTRDSYMKALYFSIRHFPTSLAVSAINLFPLFLAFGVPNGLTPALVLMIFFGFSVQALTNTILLRRAFRDFLPEVEHYEVEEDWLPGEDGSENDLSAPPQE